MRRVVRCAFLATTIAVVAAGLPACDPFDLCGSATLNAVSTSAAERATSCVESVSYAGHGYSPWCAAVRPELLLAAPRLSGGDVNTEYDARLIEGVPAEEAIAVATRYPNASKGTEELKRDCGKWRYAPEEELSDAEAETLAERVTIPGPDRSG